MAAICFRSSVPCDFARRCNVTSLVGAIALTLSVQLSVDAPPSLASAEARIRAIDGQELSEALARAGLEMPDDVRVELIPEDDERARGVPSWIVGSAFGTGDIVIFPGRIASYPYDSIESVLRHEMVHVALAARAGGGALPRWFHEGVATSVEAGWGVRDQLRLLVAMASEPRLPEIARLFESDSQPATTLAYLLAAASVDDLRGRHGAAVPGAIAARVADGVPFHRAFAIETGESPATAAATAWAGYRRWVAWLPALTSPNAAWTLILVLAFLAYVARLRQRPRRRRQWDEEGEID